MTTPKSTWVVRAAAKSLPASDRTGTVLRTIASREPMTGGAVSPHVLTVACLQGTCPRHTSR